MKKSVVFLVILISIFCSSFNAFAQEMDKNCNLENYVFIDSLMIDENLIDDRTFRLYAKDYKISNLLIKSEKEYLRFKSADAEDIDFEKYKILVGLVQNYCGSRVNISLLFDKFDNQHIISIVHLIYVPYVKGRCGQHLIVVKVPKEYSDRIFYTEKFIKNTQNEN